MVDAAETLIFIDIFSLGVFFVTFSPILNQSSANAWTCPIAHASYCGKLKIEITKIIAKLSGEKVKLTLYCSEAKNIIIPSKCGTISDYQFKRNLSKRRCC